MTHDPNAKQWTLRVMLPDNVPDADRERIITAVADAAYDACPDDRDGWDIYVMGGDESACYCDECKCKARA